jgi:pimeloyl-ACP methyl ester carboxylesterase
MSSPTASADLFHISINASSNAPTIVLLHGLCSSRLEFAYVIPHLEQTFHILAVDLPAHSRSSSLPSDQPFTLSFASSQVASLIRKYAHNGHAHVVGLSLGGFVSLKLLEEHPDLVESLWVTGAAPFAGFNRWIAQRPTMVYYMIKTLTLLPSWLYNLASSWQGLTRHDELRQEMVSNGRFPLIRDAYSTVLEFSYDDVAKIGATGKRVLTVAGGRMDDVESTRKMGTLLKKSGSPQSKAVVVKKAVHAWDLQFPELFAQGITAWIGGDALPQDYEALDES